MRRVAVIGGDGEARAVRVPGAHVMDRPGCGRERPGGPVEQVQRVALGAVIGAIHDAVVMWCPAVKDDPIGMARQRRRDASAAIERMQLRRVPHEKEQGLTVQRKPGLRGCVD